MLRGSSNFLFTSLKHVKPPGDQILYGGALITERASCHRRGAKNFEVVSEFWGKFVQP
jgi:hypothetical protein